MQKSIQTLIEETKEDLNNIIDNKVELCKLAAYEKGVPVGVKVAYNSVLFLLLLFVLGLLLVSAALAMAMLFSDGDVSVIRAVSLGFLSVGGILLLIGLIMLLLRKSVVRSVYNKIIGKMLDETPEVINTDALAIGAHQDHHNINTQEEQR